MSLQLLAKQMEAKGRKGDSMLVHMTPGEVEGLQKLAESMGGSLSVNPETGLVEANFLKKLISSPLFAPLAGAGLMMIPGVGPMMAAGLVGGGTALATGDIGKGAMAGLGAYGGAGLAGGLMGAGNAAASQAASAANPAFTGPMPGAASGFEAAKAGVSALGNEAGRSAFMQGVGGVGGLAKAAGAVAAPMMMPQEQKMAEAPVDDEMYYTEYNPGQTGKRSSTSTEALQFAGGYTPMESIKAEDYMKRRNNQFSAAQGGLMSLAEGGETAAPAEAAAPSASEAALAYLMGERSSSAGLPAVRAPSTPASNIGVGGDNMYAFDPATGTFLRNPNVAGAESSGSRVGTSFASSGGGDNNAPMSQETIDFFDRETPPQREARMAEVNNLFSLGPTAAFVNAVTGSGFDARAPDVGMLTGTSDAYKNLGYDYNQAGGYDPSSGQTYAESVGMSDYPGSDIDQGDRGEAAGGLISLAKGGMASGGFVVPADVVSMIGEGNTDAGYKRIKSMVPGATAIKGKDGGQADTVKTHIDGKQPARVAHGEMYIPPETVKRMGGAKKLYAMMDRVREQATGSKKQIKPVSLKQAMA